MSTLSIVYKNQKGIAHLFLLLILAAAVLIYLAVTKGLIKLPSQSLINKEPTVAVKSQYVNPFDKNSQYVNPFDQYKSPFLDLSK